MEYDHMSFGGPPVTTDTAEEAHAILQSDQKESDLGNFSCKITGYLSHLICVLA